MLYSVVELMLWGLLMRLNCKITKNDTYLYILDSQRIGGKVHTRIVKKCGRLSELINIYPDPISHFRDMAKSMSRKENSEIVIKLRRNYRPTSDTKFSEVHVGHFFLRKIYNSLNLDTWCRNISRSENFEFNFNEIFSNLIYGCYLFPGSKLSIFDELKKFIDAPSFELHQLYRALGIINKHLSSLQEHLYKNVPNVCKRNTKLLYYDCTNYYFEIDNEDIKEVFDDNGSKTFSKGLRSRGHEKNGRKDPIVSLGLLLDGNGIPLAFYVFNGNLNEQATLKELEKKIINEFGHSEFVICTDAGLGSFDNKVFNSLENRRFVISQPVKKITGEIEKWMLNPKGWRYFIYNKDTKSHDISNPIDIDNLTEEERELHHSTVFFKDEFFEKSGKFKDDNEKEKNLTMSIHYIITFSFEKQEKQSKYRQHFINKAKEIISHGAKINKAAPNDIKRYIQNLHFTSNGEIATETSLDFNEEQVKEDAKYDGYYCVSTNLEADIRKILKIHYGRWEIEETFMYMRQDFKARPIYLSKEERIIAHFGIHFVVLLISRIIEQLLNDKGFNTFEEILKIMRNFKLAKVQNKGYTPLFDDNPLSAKIQKTFGLDFFFEGLTIEDISKLHSESKKKIHKDSSK